ncbi:MAG: hypothetical protein N4A41_10515 [Crocinitomicaceae bacterium]|nr:hypothetical protein [Crocinitomicaceae bacterium]
MKSVLLIACLAWLTSSTEVTYHPRVFIGTYRPYPIPQLPRVEPTEEKGPVLITKIEVQRMPYFQPMEQIEFATRNRFTMYFSKVMNSPYSQMIRKTGTYEVHPDKLVLHYTKSEYWEAPEIHRPARKERANPYRKPRRKKKHKSLDAYDTLAIIRPDSLVYNQHFALVRVIETN